MAKPIYSRHFDDDCLPASQVINDADDSDDDFHSRFPSIYPAIFLSLSLLGVVVKGELTQ